MDVSGPSAGEPVAVIGLGCRLPGGVDTPDKYWELLVSGENTIGDLPPGRWDGYRTGDDEYTAALGQTHGRGSYLDHPGDFDAAFFGVTPREAEIMDPQQRIVLETAWEALEHACIPPDSLVGTGAAVFMGVGSDDYGRHQLEDLPRVEAWSGIGASCCAVANRLSYLLDLRGPSFTIDAACASSLVAVHLACASLRQRETGLALAGGVNVIASPALTLALDAAHALSESGESRPFDAAADGYVRGEGAGVLVLKRLADAGRDRDQVFAVIRGSAVRHGGRTNGIMAPSGAAQESVIREALRQAGAAPASVAYVEAHGTATRAGDPVEVAALSRVYGRDRAAEHPLLIGSVKGNIGHQEAAAGVVGIIKAVLALDRGWIPPQAGFAVPNPGIAWAGSGIEVASAGRGWPDADGPRRAGVSSFGYGGAVGHLILEEAPAATAPAEDQAAPQMRLFPVSGATEAAVRAGAGRLAALAAGPAAPSLTDMHHSLWHGRTHQRFRVAVAAADRAALTDGLGQVAAGESSVTRAFPAPAAAPVLVFSGHGSQWSGMGRELLSTAPAFARAIAEIEPVYRDQAGWSPASMLREARLNGTDQTQAMIFAVQVGLARMLDEAGVRPGAIVGHSVGEVAAAVTAGALSLADGARLICHRSLLLRQAAGAGAMLLVRMGFTEAWAALHGQPDISPAIESSPGSTVVAGTPAAVSRFADACRRADVPVRPVASDVAFHTAQMNPLSEDLERALAGIHPAAPAVPLYTTALDDPRAAAPRDAAYWAANLRNPVRLATAVRALAADDFRVFLEVSPHPVITFSIGETLTDAGVRDFSATGTLLRHQPERPALTASLGRLFCAGVTLAPGGQAAVGGKCALPPTAWRHERFWRTARPAPAWDDGGGAATATLLGAADPTAPGEWRSRLEPGTRPYPGSHRVHGVEVVPAAILLNTLFCAVGRLSLCDVEFSFPLMADNPREVRVTRRGDALQIQSRALAGETGRDDGWVSHVNAAARSADVPPGHVDLDELRLASPTALPADRPGRRLAESGISGQGFPWRTEEIRAGRGRLLCTIRVGGAAAGRWAAFLDAAVSVAPLVFGESPSLRLLAGIRRVAVTGPAPSAVVADVRRTADGHANVRLLSADGYILAEAEGLRYRSPDDSLAAHALVRKVSWRRLPGAAVPAPSETPRTLVLIGGDETLGEPLAKRADAEGIRTVRVRDLEHGLPRLGQGDALVVLGTPRPARDDDPGEVSAAARASAWTLIRAAQLLAAAEPVAGVRLWCVTAGVKEGDGSLSQAPLWGVGAVIAGEHPGLWGGLADLDQADLDAGAAALLEQIRNRRQAGILAFRDGAVLAARLVALDGEHRPGALLSQPDGAYLITGGRGALGLRVAEWLAARGARRLILLGRTPMPDRGGWAAVTDPADLERVRAIRRIEDLGAHVATPAADVCDRAALERLLGEEGPVRGVVHAAGVLDSRLLTGLDAASLETVLRPKVHGALVLDQLFPPGSLDFLVFFSSVGQYLELPGQASYAAANAFLDALAVRRRAMGDTQTMSVCWTSWGGLGMAGRDSAAPRLWDRGVGALTPDQAFLAWEYAARYDSEVACVFPRTADGAARRVPPALRDQVSDESAAGESADPRTEQPDLRVRLAAVPAAQRGQLITDRVAAVVAREIGIPQESLDVRLPLTDLGLDSVMTLGVRQALEERFRLVLPAALLWGQSSAADLADHLAERLDADRTGR